LFLLLLLAGAVGRDGYTDVRDHVERVEINHLFSDQCKLVLTQVIAWRLNEDGEYEVRQWWMVTAGSKPITYRDFRRRRRVLLLPDNKTMYKCRRRLEADSVFESWTTDDPELANREVTPDKLRQRLTPTGWRARVRQMIDGTYDKRHAPQDYEYNPHNFYGTFTPARWPNNRDTTD
jgi:hypothetical protein